MAATIPFRVIGEHDSIPLLGTEWVAYLKRDNWDDWGKYSTQFYLTIVDIKGIEHNIGSVKIGQRGLKPHDAVDVPLGFRTPNVPSTFVELDDTFFSVGQDDEYYTNLSNVDVAVREEVLKRLRDVAFDGERWQWAKDEDVMIQSLLRYVTSSTVRGQFQRLAHGDPRLTTFKFIYTPPTDDASSTPLDFCVDPDSEVPTNVHVLIGRNGVGKTRLLSLMVKSLIEMDASNRPLGSFKFHDQNETFANVVAVSFSAFDEAEVLPDRRGSLGNLGYSYIGLRALASNEPDVMGNPKSPARLAEEFVDSLSECRIGSRLRRWQRVVGSLKADPVFRAAQLDSIISKNVIEQSERAEVIDTFMALSSGHKIVLLTLTRLVEKVEERTLVLIDEPEAHLHPPLLSAMTRSISELMVNRNGVAILATHSPVILQEVPRSCVWILNRIQSVATAARPSMETFAENVGTLSREVFQLELSQSGYHQLLAALRKEVPTYGEALERMNGQLGAEGKAVLRALYLSDTRDLQT